MNVADPATPHAASVTSGDGGAQAVRSTIVAKKRGNAFGFWVFRTCVRLLGLRGAYGLLYPVCLYYLLVDSQAVSDALAYITRRFRGAGRLAMRIHAYRLFVNQGKQIIDRYAHISAEGLFDIRLSSTDESMRLLKDHKQGVVLLTAHVGNWQVAMSRLSMFGRSVYLVMRPEDNPAVRDALKISEENETIRIISPEGDLGGVIEIMNTLQQGHIVSIMGDRKYGFSAVPVDYIGEPALFPNGAFSIAAAAGCPIVVLLSMKTGPQSYEVDITHVLHPRYERGGRKQDQVRAWVQEYAGILEEYVRRYPYQCFLFHDVWADVE